MSWNWNTVLQIRWGTISSNSQYFTYLESGGWVAWPRLNSPLILLVGNGSWWSAGKGFSFFFSKQEEGFPVGRSLFLLCSVSKPVLGLDRVPSPPHSFWFPSHMSFFSPFLPPLMLACFERTFSFPWCVFLYVKQQNTRLSSLPFTGCRQKSDEFLSSDFPFFFSPIFEALHDHVWVKVWKEEAVPLCLT